MKKKSRRNITKHLDSIYLRWYSSELDGYLPESEVRFLLKQLRSKDSLWKSSAAAVLGSQIYSREIEDALYLATFDKDMLVRAEAADSLRIGRQERTLNRLKELSVEPDFFVRTYAVMSYFSVFTELRGYTKDTMREYLQETGEPYRREANEEVQIMYMACRYLAGLEEELNRLLDKLEKNIKDCDRNYWVIVGVLRLIPLLVNTRNEHEIKRALNAVYPKVAEQFEDKKRGKVAKVLSDRIQGLLRNKNKAYILIVDEKNDGLSQLMEAAGYMEEIEDCQFVSAGLLPADRISARAEKLAKSEYEYDICRYQAPDPILSLYTVDAVVPIGLEDAQERFPLNRIIPIFQDYKEIGEETVEQIEGMLYQIVEYWRKERKSN